MPHRHPPSLISLRTWALACLPVLAACAPGLDWREVRPEGANLLLMFPCKPASDARQVEMQGRTFDMRLYACKTSNQSFALSYVDVGDPALVGPALQQMRQSLAAKLAANPAAGAASAVPVQVGGMTPNPQALQQSLAGKLPDGSGTQGAVAVFAHGTRVFQAVVLGAKRDAAAEEGFLNGMKFAS
ncbi:hypothetical protein [Roseateles toxinivorans]|uniref:Lipoprotein n=1 Tax=Roseateles toxinivorans TaxID=270368 RepID=A0A4R6QQF0_9BURK|nr:hypothetical protein [Roseateles toxinivorans]TDP73246.1 hypothetical protein DES47_102993 [Roseateles toxinivorans]